MKRNTQGRNGAPRGWVPRASTSSCRAAPGSPGLAPATDRDWTQGCTDRDRDQDRRQDKEQGPLQKAAMDEDSEPVINPYL